MEFDETPRFWYPRVACDELIDFYSWTIEIRPLECQENLPFFSLSLSDSPLSLSLPCLLSFIFFSFSFLFFLPLSTCTSLSCLFNPYLFSFISIFSFLIVYSLHFSLFSSFYILDYDYPYGSSGGNFPPLSPLATCHHHVFLPYFLYFLFPFHYIM